jgi:outer membrane protein OmpA-like peptidoglycan-associated protein
MRSAYNWRRVKKLAFVACMLASVHVWADDTPPMEAGLFAGGFISNYFHDFYDSSKFPNGDRPLLDRVSPELGLRYAYFFHSYIGAEVEGSMIIATTEGMNWAGQGSNEAANIYNGRVQAILQLPLPGARLYPFVAAGLGVMHTSSDYLGSDTDFPIHVGAGARLYATSSIAVRADVRFLRGPSEQAPHTLNASYGEFMIGLSWSPHAIARNLDVPHHEELIVDQQKDSDGDGIPDAQDKCPNEPEDKDGFEDTDGCPDPDNDGDGIPDTVDKCPLDPEDKDGFQDDDGCPDPDNDFDGIPDARDKCPNEPEDQDGFQDTDGCPDLDNDNDGIPDAQDKCPTDPETINGNQDDDGCPDRGEPAVILSPDRLDLLDAITFRGTTIAKSSLNVLGQLAATLRAHTEIVRLRLTVYVQPSNDLDKDQELSDQRAQALRDWLVQWGIAAKRLEPRGFGGTKPLVQPDTKGAAAINDRVELIILERK